GALVDDDLAHLAVVEHVADVVVLGQQRLRALVEFGIDLDRLRRRLFMVEDAQVGVETQAREREDLGAGLRWRLRHHGRRSLSVASDRNLKTSTPTASQSGYTSGLLVDRRTAWTSGCSSRRCTRSSHSVSCN